MLVDEFDCLVFEHVAHCPGSRSDVALDGVCEGVQTGGCCKSLRHAHHQLAVDNRADRNVVRVHADHLLAVFLICDDIVDCNFRSCSRSGRDSESRHSLVSGRCSSFERTYVSEFRVVEYDADCLGCVHRRTAAEGDHAVSSGGLEPLQTVQDVLDCRVRLDFAVDFVWDRGALEHILDHCGDTELHEVLVGHEQCFPESALLDFVGDGSAASRSVVRGFVKDDSFHYSFCWFVFYVSLRFSLFLWSVVRFSQRFRSLQSTIQPGKRLLFHVESLVQRNGNRGVVRIHFHDVGHVVPPFLHDRITSEIL